MNTEQLAAGEKVIPLRVQGLTRGSATDENGPSRIKLLPRYPFERHGGSVTMLGPTPDDSRWLNCLIEGDPIVFAIPVKPDCPVSHLKLLVKIERALDTLKDPHVLELYKVSDFDKSPSEVSLGCSTG